MPAPTTVCCVCRKEVSKSQTSHIGGGKRACKKHEGIPKQAGDIQREAREKNERQKAAYRELCRRWFAKIDAGGAGSPEASMWTWFECWTCGAQGIEVDPLVEHIAHAIPSVRGERLDLMDLPPAVAEHVGNMVLPLRRVRMPGDPARGRILDCIRKASGTNNAASVVASTGVVQVCPLCAQEFGIDFPITVTLDRRKT